MLARQERWREDPFIAAPLRDLIPDDHILRGVDRRLDPSRLRNAVRDQYRQDCMRPSTAPPRLKMTPDPCSGGRSPGVGRTRGARAWRARGCF